MREVSAIHALGVASFIIEDFPNAIYRVCNRPDAMYVELTLYYSDPNGIQVSSRTAITKQDLVNIGDSADRLLEFGGKATIALKADLRSKNITEF